ncbi:MAG: hypothetical protein VKJ64_03290 [Leptolyngbyaceae bacterium]|nr:hypothetical protein [Leptolyngbyaceae bacterium]
MARNPLWEGRSPLSLSSLAQALLLSFPRKTSVIFLKGMAAEMSDRSQP